MGVSIWEGNKAERVAAALEAIASGASSGIPDGGTQGQVLAKSSAADYDVEWVNQDGGNADIDDTAGSGDTDKVWSANKLTTEFDNTQTMILVQDSQPTEIKNKLWFDLGSVAELSVASTTDLDELSDSISAQATEIDAKLDAPNIRGENGQVLTSDGNGGQSWQTISAATDAQVAEAVTDWLNTNVPSGQTLVVDSSLTVQGAAADSKTTGDAIAQQSAEIAELNTVIDQIAYKPIIEVETTNPGYATHSGQNKVVVYTSSFPGSAVKKYDVSKYAGKTIYITAKRLSGTTTMFYEIADASGNTVGNFSSSDVTITNKAVILPATSAFIYVNYNNTDNIVSVNTYESINNLQNDIDEVKGKIYCTYESDLSPTNTYADIYAYNTASGVGTKTVAGTTVTMYSVSNNSGNKLKISTECINSENAIPFMIARTGETPHYINNPATLVYDEYVIDLDEKDTILYINCKSNITPKVTLVDVKYIQEFFDDYTSSERIVGKKCVCFGDSITWYDGHAYNWGAEQGVVATGYESYMRNAGMIVDNQGYSGATLKNIVQSKVLNYDFTNCDYVTLTSGANDARYLYTVGEVTEIGSTYADTFIGWLQTALDYILSQNPEIKILLITPIRGWIYTPDGYAARPAPAEDGIIGEEYPNAIKAVAEKYALPVCDWYSDCGLNILTRAWYINDPEPDETAETNPNILYSLHPSTKGYKRMADLLLPIIRAI